jgi:hypothetical protein
MDRHDEILDYLYDRMDPAMRGAFEAELRNDATLREWVETEQKLNRVLDRVGELSPRDDSLESTWAAINGSAWRDEAEVSVQRSWWKRYHGMEIAAAAGLLIAVGLMAWGGVFSSTAPNEPSESGSRFAVQPDAEIDPDAKRDGEAKNIEALLANPPFENPLFLKVLDQVTQDGGMEDVSPDVARRTGIDKIDDWAAIAKGLKY